MKEIRKPVVGYEGLYEVSESGLIYSLARWTGYYTKDEKILKKELNAGYERVLLSKNSKTKTCLVHRLVAEAFIPNPENKKFVNHKDSKRDNNSVLNLEWSTAKENARHGIAQGYINTYKKQISWEDRLKIYNHYKPGSSDYGSVETAKLFGVGNQTVLNIKYELDILFKNILDDGIFLGDKFYKLVEQSNE